MFISKISCAELRTWNCLFLNSFKQYQIIFCWFLFHFDCEETRTPKKSKEGVLKDWSQKSNLKSEKVNYTSDILVESNFGIPGAITITNKHQKEFYLESITIEGFACGPVYFPCNSWVQSVNDHPEPRIFFSNQVIIVRDGL